MLGVIGRTYFTTAGLSESLHSEVIECKGGGRVCEWSWNTPTSGRWGTGLSVQVRVGCLQRHGTRKCGLGTHVPGERKVK